MFEHRVLFMSIIGDNSNKGYLALLINDLKNDLFILV